MDQLNSIALPANKLGHAMYCFPTEVAARQGFPNLIVETHPQPTSGLSRMFQGVRNLFSKKAAPSVAPPTSPQPALADGHIQTLRRARELMQASQCLEALALVSAAIKQTEGAAEDWEYGPHLMAAASEASLHGNGSMSVAVQSIEEAIRMCQNRRDLEGVLVYSNTALELYRYHGKTAEATKLCKSLAHLYSQIEPEQGRYYAAWSEIIASGEPLLRLQALVGQSKYEIDDIPMKFSGSLQLIYVRNRITLAPCEAMVSYAKSLAEQGKLEVALEHFQSAAALDAYAPDCHYQSGFALLSLKRYSQAVESNRRAESLAPGWFSCRLDAWLGEQLQQRQIGHETWEVLNRAQDGGDGPNQRLAYLEQIRPSAEGLGLFHLYVGNAQRELGRVEEARVSFRLGLKSKLEEEVCTKLLVGLGAICVDPSERRDLYQKATELGGHLLSQAAARVALRNESS